MNKRSDNQFRKFLCWMALGLMILSLGLGMSGSRAALAREAAAAPYQIYLPLVLRAFPGPPPGDQTLTVNLSGTGSGTVTSDPAGIDCGPTCSIDFDSGTVVTLTAVESPGSTFTGWSGSGCAGTDTCAVTMDAARSVSATFTLNFYALVVSKIGGGSGTVTSSPAGIDCGSICEKVFAYNSEVTLAATPISPATFVGWSGGGCSGTGICTVTMSAEQYVTATFSFFICNEIVNCDFEADATGWIVYSDLRYPLIYSSTDPKDPLPITPHSGIFAAWLGGDDDETAYLQQQVSISPGDSTLVYWHWIVSYDTCGDTDYAEVVINGIQVEQYDLCTGTSTIYWVPHSVNLSAYAGQSVTLRIGVKTNSSNYSNLFVDDVTLQAGAPAPAPLQDATSNMQASTPKGWIGIVLQGEQPQGSGKNRNPASR